MRDGEREVRDLVAGRERDERAISLATPYYDVVRQKHGESDEEAEEASEVAVDYLTQFLPLVTGTRSLNRPEALEVRERSLKVSPAVGISPCRQGQLDSISTASSLAQHFIISGITNRPLLAYALCTASALMHISDALTICTCTCCSDGVLMSVCQP